MTPPSSAYREIVMAAVETFPGRSLQSPRWGCHYVSEHECLPLYSRRHGGCRPGQGRKGPDRSPQHHHTHEGVCMVRIRSGRDGRMSRGQLCIKEEGTKDVISGMSASKRLHSVCKTPKSRRARFYFVVVDRHLGACKRALFAVVCESTKFEGAIAAANLRLRLLRAPWSYRRAQAYW